MANPTPETLRRLFAEVMRTREALAEERHGGVPWAQLLDSRLENLQALENYVAALERLSFPVPRQIRDELRLTRMLCAQRDGRG
jgi:hypothetical protein